MKEWKRSAGKALPICSADMSTFILSTGHFQTITRRDAAVIYALSHDLSPEETEELLASLPEPGLYGGEG